MSLTRGCDSISEEADEEEDEAEDDGLDLEVRAITFSRVFSSRSLTRGNPKPKGSHDYQLGGSVSTRTEMIRLSVRSLAVCVQVSVVDLPPVAPWMIAVDILEPEVV